MQVQGLKPGAFKLRVSCIQLVQPLTLRTTVTPPSACEMPRTSASPLPASSDDPSSPEA
jgi:hypothetical protein